MPMTRPPFDEDAAAAGAAAAAAAAAGGGEGCATPAAPTCVAVGLLLLSVEGREDDEGRFLTRTSFAATSLHPPGEEPKSITLCMVVSGEGGKEDDEYLKSISYKHTNKHLFTHSFISIYALLQASNYTHVPVTSA
jgi:hypothetical protein